MTMGETMRNAKLTNEDVVNMRKEYDEEELTTAHELGDRYGVDASTAARIITGKAWSHVGGPIQVGKLKGGRRS